MKVARTLIRNPLLLSPAIGALYATTGLSIPAPVETFLKLLGGAASPCALVALGLFLASPSSSTSAHYRASAGLVGLKLVAQPALTYWLAYHVFHLTPLLTHAATLMAALPTGTGPFMLAEFYNREAMVTSKTILISTALSVLTISGYLAFGI